MMEQVKYKISWTNRKTGETGEGEPVFNNRNMAQITANGLNTDFPHISHVVVEEIVKVTTTHKNG